MFAQSGPPSRGLHNLAHHTPVAGSMKSAYFIGGVEQLDAFELLAGGSRCGYERDLSVALYRIKQRKKFED